MVGQGKWFQWGSKCYDSHELVILASLCAAFSLSDYLEVGHMRVSLCFSLLFSTEIAKPSLSALPGLTVRARLCLWWQMWPQNQVPSLPLSGSGSILPQGLWSPWRLTYLVWGQFDVRGEGQRTDLVCSFLKARRYRYCTWFWLSKIMVENIEWEEKEDWGRFRKLNDTAVNLSVSGITPQRHLSWTPKQGRLTSL